MERHAQRMRFTTPGSLMTPDGAIREALHAVPHQVTCPRDPTYLPRETVFQVLFLLRQDSLLRNHIGIGMSAGLRLLGLLQNPAFTTNRRTSNCYPSSCNNRAAVPGVARLSTAIRYQHQRRRTRRQLPVAALFHLDYGRRRLITARSYPCGGLKVCK